MYPSILPSKVKAEEDSSIYCKRTTNRIVKSKKNSNPLSRLTTRTDNNQASKAHHFNHHHHRNNSDGTSNTTNINSGSCKKDNDESVMCMLTGNLQKFDFIRPRTKFPVAFHLIACIIFLTVNIAFSNAIPVPTTNDSFDCSEINTILDGSKIKKIDCSADISRCLNITRHQNISQSMKYNVLQTNFTMAELQGQIREYQKTVNENDEYVNSWSHFGEIISNVSVSSYFKGSSFLNLFEKNLHFMYGHLYNITKLLNFHICRHTNYPEETKHYMSLEGMENEIIISQLMAIRSNTNQSIYLIQDTLRDFGFEKIPFEFTKNCTLLGNTTSTSSEITTMKKLEGTLELMSKIFAHIQNEICMRTE